MRIVELGDRLPDESADSEIRPLTGTFANLGQRCRIRICSGFRTKLIGMDAAGYQQRLQAGMAGAGDVGAARIADPENECIRPQPECSEDSAVDTLVRLAVIAYETPQLLIAQRQSAGADLPNSAADHFEIGIGANHRQLAFSRGLQQRLEIVG